MRTALTPSMHHTTAWIACAFLIAQAGCVFRESETSSFADLKAAAGLTIVGRADFHYRRTDTMEVTVRLTGLEPGHVYAFRVERQPWCDKSPEVPRETIMLDNGKDDYVASVDIARAFTADRKGRGAVELQIVRFSYSKPRAGPHQLNGTRATVRACEPGPSPKCNGPMLSCAPVSQYWYPPIRL